nr:hypothetical protein [Tanacetum cinerariifolium]
MLNNSQGKKQEVEDHRRNVKFSKNKTSVTACNDSLNAKTSNVNSVCVTCGKCMLKDKHDMCVLQSRNGVNSRTKMPMAVPISTREPKCIVNQSVAKPFRRTVASESTNQKPKHTTRKLYEHVSKVCSWWYPKFTPPGYKWKPKSQIGNVNPNVSMPLGNASRTVNILEPMTPRRFTMSNTTLYSNSFAAPRDYPIHRLNYNLFSVGQFCDADLEVTFRKSTYYIRDLKGNDLLTAWLWHRRLSHLNFDTINLLSKNDIVIGLPKLKFVKDHLCSSCEFGKAKRKYFRTKTTPSSKRRLQLLHMDLCSPMRVESINGKKYVLVIPRHEKTPYHIINDRKPSVMFFYIFGSLFYNVRDGENLDKIKKKCDACIFAGLSPGPKSLENVPIAAGIVTTSKELELLFGSMFDELHNGSTSSVVNPADAPNQCQQQNTTPLNTQTTSEPTCQVPTQAPTVTSTENINQSETITENEQVKDDEFINIFCTPVQDRGETSSRHVDSSNMHTFYQRHPSEHRWMKDHLLEQVIGNPSQSVRTRHQLESDGEMCMFALTVSRTEPKNIKEAMADSAWIESMQVELHQFDRLDVWELVDRPLCKNVINIKWIWKNKRDEENTLRLRFYSSFPRHHIVVAFLQQKIV